MGVTEEVPVFVPLTVGDLVGVFEGEVEEDPDTENDVEGERLVAADRVVDVEREAEPLTVFESDPVREPRGDFDKEEVML